MARSLMQNDLTIHRYYMQDALDMLGIPARYYQLKPGMKFTVAGEIKGNYFDPEKCAVIFDQVPTVRTLKRLGWVTELEEETHPIVHVSFDLPGIQVGCLFEVKDPLAQDKGRFFRITKMSTGIIYPAGVTCQIVPVMGSDPEATTDPYDGDKSIFLDKAEGGDEY